MAYDDVLIKSGVVVPTTADHRDKEDDDSIEPAAVMRRIIILFDTGRLHTIDIKLDNNGLFDCEGDVSLEYGEGTSFPITGVRRYTGTIPETAGTTSKSLGEGSTLVFLRQSRILLYKCVSSALVAFMLDDGGTIVGNFEFLPHIIKPEKIDDSDNESISGPYSNWTELGCIEKADSMYYRAAFIGKSTRSNKPLMMYIEYNHDNSSLKKMKIPGMGLSMMSSFEGMAAFSGPMVVGNNRNDGMLGQHGIFKERIYFASVTSNGILAFHGEEMTAISKNGTSTASIMSNRRRAIIDSGMNRQEISGDRVKFKDAPNPFPAFPLTVFETLQNVTSADELFVSSDGIVETSANLKRKLVTGSSDYIISRSKDGCAFIMSLQPRTKSKTSNDSAKVKLDDPSKYAIVAVRILLGTNNVDFTPRDISVMGRAIKPARQKKRWYDVPLSDEEIMLGVRSGFVPIVISGGEEGDRSQAIVDSIEVYAEERTKLSHLFPIKSHIVPDARNHHPVVNIGVGGRREALDTSIVVISHVFKLMGGVPGLTSSITEESLQRLIQVTALDSEKEGNVRNHVIGLLKDLETNTHAMQVLLDKGTLQGICNVLKELDGVVRDCQDTTSDKEGSIVITGRLGSKILARVNDCLVAAGAIVKERPSNYKNAIESLIGGKTTNLSIALHAKSLVEACKHCPGVIITTSKLVDITLHEILAASIDHGAQNTKSLANLETLSGILRSSSQDIVKSCCDTVAKVVKNLKDVPTQVLLHQCDCCGILPITKTRFTMDEEGYDIDLCQGCYEKGITFAIQNKYSPKISVLVEKGPIYIAQHDNNLSCHEICQMSSKPVPESSIDELSDFRSQGQTKSNNVGLEMEEDDEDKQLQIALKMSLEESQENTYDPSVPTTLATMIFKKLLDDTVHDLSALENPRKSNSLHLMTLLLTLVVQCNKHDERAELARIMCETLCKEICTLSDICTICSDEQSPMSVVKRGRHAIVLYLRALTSLITKQESLSTNPTTLALTPAVPTVVIQVPPSKSKTDPRFICEAHSVPAVRRRCSHGEHKDRRFYVCGMSRKNRCKYFKWADEVDDIATTKGHTEPTHKNSSPPTKPVVDKHLRSILWNLLNEGNPPLHRKLCTLLRSFIKNSKASASAQLKMCPRNPTPKKSSIVMQHLHSTQNANNDDDGVFLSMEKLGFSGFQHGFQLTSKSSLSVSLGSSEYLSAEASLDFLALVGAHTTDITQKTYASWESWYSPLCHIISKNFGPDLRSRAKEMLKCITGGRRATYRQVRDRFVFASQFMELLSHCESPLQASLFVREKARQCGPQWRLSNVTWDTLGSGGLLGAQSLISEDYYVVTVMEQVTKMLDTLISTISKSRSDNWRHFCSLEKLPQQDTDLEGDTAYSASFMEEGLHDRSPICLLLWMACSVPARSQEKLLYLMDVALTDSVFGKPDSKCRSLSITSSNVEDSHGIMSTDGGTDIEPSTLAAQWVNEETPEKVLLSGASGLSVNDICAFIIGFVVNGGSAELRIHAKNIATILTSQSPPDNLDLILQRMATICLREVGSLGKQSIEFLQMLITLISNDGLMCGVDIEYISQVSIACFTGQTSSNTNVMNTHWNTNMYSASSERFDVTKCTYCQCCYKGDTKVDFKKTSSSAAKASTSSSSSVKEQERLDDTNIDWALEQLTDYRKMRLDQHHTVSAEFSQYVQLKTRLSIHELYVNVSEQRGRFVKSIAVYFSPRPVNDVSELKDGDYTALWQQCGNLTLSRGASKATLRFPEGVVAANLKFEYLDFYEKITGPRSSTGAMVLHCPRCTRVVNNALGGVCGHCGEVAFQCRKCRHINYDRLDAFLCVECGYCSSGSFSYEVQAGEAVSAVAILDERDLERTVASLHARNRKYSEVKSLLKKQIPYEKNFSGTKRTRDQLDITDRIDGYSAPLKRALLGEFPKITVNKSITDKKKDTKRPEPLGRGSASTRARSLLSLARQLRGDSESDVRSSLGDLLVQQARLSSGSRNGFPFDDGEDELIVRSPGEANIMPFEMQDPLSRLVANIQARARGELDSSARRSEGEAKHGETEIDGVNSNNAKTLEVAKKCFKQLKGIEKDCSEISGRIVAWKRLNQDALADYGAIMAGINYTSVHCSNCAPAVTYNLLELVCALLLCNMESAEKVLSGEFIRCLFDDQMTDAPELVELKSEVLVTISKNSVVGSGMILKELKLRLNGGKDPISAEILGRLIGEASVKSHASYVELAVSTLNG
jgi:E3 ubiquitin-protein ligase UBR4